MAYQMRAVFFITLVMSLDMHAMSVKRRFADDNLQRTVQVDYLQRTLQLRIVQQAHRSNSTEVTKEPSAICKAMFDAASWFGKHSDKLNRMFDINSAAAISHHLTQVYATLQGYGIDSVATFTSSTLNTIPLWIGSIWGSVEVLKGHCESTLGTCVGIVSIVSLLISLVFVVIYLLPAFVVAVAAKVGLATSTAFLSSHLGHLITSVVLLVTRKIMGVICQVRFKEAFIKAGSVLQHMLAWATEIAAALNQPNEITEKEVTDVLQDMLRGSISQVVDGAVQAGTEALLKIQDMVTLQKQSLELATDGLHNGNIGRFVNEHELDFGDNAATKYPPPP
mmetsp:Transcript_105862/g.193041  ORF Transcript_105862/g.193041 Transcript_105862/m.193041 type:complete len:336 (-) Transcript_105862:73-1080(-)